MVERVAIGYQRLFEVRLLNHYWLDEGATVFDQINDPAKTAERLLTYDVRPFLNVEPTPTTAKALAGYRCLFRATALGLVVAAPGTTVIPANTTFDFVVSIANGAFNDYTALTLRPQRIYELFNTADGITYRYKENVPLLSNLSGATRTVGANTTLFLSSETPAATASDQVEFLVLSGGALLQLTSDQPGATTQQLAAQATDLPAFVHQGDSPVIVPPAGLVGAPARGVRLSADVPDDVFALIHVQAVRAANDAFSFVDGTGAPKNPGPVYEVRFRNRSTVWTYLDARTGAVNSTEANALPLTFFGNAGTQQKPSRGSVKVAFSGTRITQLISEIYI